MIGVLAVIGIIYGALVLPRADRHEAADRVLVGRAHGLRDARHRDAHDFGINAAIFGMVAHGLITGMLFFVAGSVKQRYHTLEISRLGGHARTRCRSSGWILGFCAMASLGLPGLAGFWGEFPAILVRVQPGRRPRRERCSARYMVIAAIGTVLAAALPAVDVPAHAFGTDAEFAATTPRRTPRERRPPRRRPRHADIHDVTRLEWIAWTPILVAIVVLGIYPTCCSRSSIRRSRSSSIACRPSSVIARR